jgi:pheromone shutdown-related protein TraB
MQLPETVTVIEDGDRTYYLLGTAHVSAQSVEEVEAVIEAVGPDTVCIELCEARFNALTNDAVWRNLDVFKVIREGKTLFLLANLAIGAYQRRMGAELGVQPGAELLAAARKADEIGARVVLIDRDIHVTLKRTWANLRFRDKFGLLGAIVGSLFSRQKISAAEIEKLKEQAHLSELLAEFAEQMPQVKGPLIDERDQYMMSRIEEAPGSRLIAVVGAAHVPGMRRQLHQPVDRAELERLPTPSRLWSSLKWVIPAVILAAFVIGYVRKGAGTFEEMLIAWILPNSIMASLFCLLAGGKLVSVAAAVVASPITSLNPLLAAGMLVGLLEAWLRKPTVADCERINQDVQSWRGIYRNPVTRVLLVAVATSLGSSLGAWIGLSWVVSLLR